MCGITGFYHFEKSRKIDKKKLKAMTDKLIHRGPDGEGYFVKNNIGLGHRRLSIIDMQTGNQPMYNDDGSIALVFNGEIYNYIELRDELKNYGFTFITHSDSEVIIKAYEYWGVECQNKFNGMWAFALWDEKRHQLFISRDRIGEKPLHYSLYDNSFIFASEMKSLFEYGVPRHVRPELIELYLVLTNIPAPFTFYRNIFKLNPGHFIIIRDGNYKEMPYWDLPFIDKYNMLNDKRSIYENFEYLLTDSVKLRMRSDVPFGAFLSGGLDSSSIVTLMAEQTKNPIYTFTMKFSEEGFDESNLAQSVAQLLKTNHYIGSVKKEDFNAVLGKVLYHYDEPFGDSSAIPVGYISKFASKKVKMVLTGDGGDEVLSGYSTYQGVKFAELYKILPFYIRSLLTDGLSKFSNLLKNKYRYKLNRVLNVLEASNLPFIDLMIRKQSFTRLDSIKLLTKNIKDKVIIEEYFSDIFSKCNYHNDFYRLMYYHFKHNLPNDYLVKVDRMSMAYSLETRIPFLDYRLIEFMVKVDKNIKLQGWETKSILRKTIGQRLPKELLKAPKKGFAIPLREWFKGDSILKHNDFQILMELLDRKTIMKVVNENKTGLQDNGNFIWSLIVLDAMMN
jgi:asparagine synthase (glutamine-hydrolysing)